MGSSGGAAGGGGLAATWPGAATGSVLTVQADDTIEAEDLPAGGLDVWDILIVPTVQRPFFGSVGANWSPNQQYDALLGGYLASAGNQDDKAVWKVPLGAGTWTMRVCYGKSANNGIMHFWVDGAEVGNADAYAAAGSFSNFAVVTGIVVAASGVKDIEIRMSTKNVSSGFYAAWLHAIQLQRSA